jgi:hypothetical protein
MLSDNASDTQPKLRFFISYASEDRAISIALSNALNKALGDVFAEVWLDTQSLRVGYEFSKQIRNQLDLTDVLLVVYTGKEKLSHSFTGVEIGYFLGVMDRSPVGVIPRRIVSFYLDQPPPATSDIQGISFSITRDTLDLTDTAYTSLVSSIGTTDPIVTFITDMENQVNRLRQAAGYGSRNIDTRDTLKCVQEMLIAVFTQLKHSIDVDNNPQKKLTVTTKPGWDYDSMDFPNDADLLLSGPSVMEMFGQQELSITWEEFLRKAPEKYRYFWKDVIETVIVSSLPDRLNVDNSQIIVSDGQPYRVILSRSVRYFDGRREFHLFFVEGLSRNDYGRRLTTRLVRGLELACRFRFMFLESESEFSSSNMMLLALTKLRETARTLIRELNLLQRDSAAAGLDEPHIWRPLVQLELLQEIVDKYGAREIEVRNAATTVIRSPTPDNNLRKELADALKKMEDVVRPLNAKFIASLGEKLKDIEHIGASIN